MQKSVIFNIKNQTKEAQNVIQSSRISPITFQDSNGNKRVVLPAAVSVAGDNAAVLSSKEVSNIASSWQSSGSRFSMTCSIPVVQLEACDTFVI